MRSSRAKKGVGLCLLLALVLFSTVGALVYDVSKVSPLSAPVSQPPSSAYPLGTDSQGRDLLAAMILGTPLTIRIGVTAGFLGLLVGTVLAFGPAYYGGVVDEKWYIQVARLSGMNGIAIIVREMMPNLIPYLAAQLVSAVAGATLASIGLEALGLGAMQTPTLGITIYWAIYFSALLLGMWWWFLPPIVIIVMLILGLFNVSAGLDELANPRLRKTA